MKRFELCKMISMIPITHKLFKTIRIYSDKALHPRDDVDRLYVPRKEGGSGLTSIEDSVDTSIHRLENYIKNTKEDSLQIPDSKLRIL